MQLNKYHSDCWHGQQGWHMLLSTETRIAVFIKLSSLAALEVIKMITSVTGNDENVVWLY